MNLPAGCLIRDLKTHRDSRGELTELFREEWPTGVRPVQWNFVRSNANVLRGVHVHVTHADYLVCAAGTLLLALVDVRPESPTHRLATLVTLRGEAMQAAAIPTGVAHGFYFPEPSIHCYSVTHYWNMADELGCRWNDPTFGLDWPVQSPELSQRDREAGSAEAMIAEYLERRQAADAHD